MLRCSLASHVSTYRCIQHNSRARARVVQTLAVEKTAFSFETKRLMKVMLTRQAIKTVLKYMSETNGELHFYLHNYVADNPLPLDGRVDADEWLVDLASSPWTKVQDPRRSSIPTAAAAAAVVNGEREVSPRDIAERVMQLRAHIALELQESLSGVHDDNESVLRRALERTFI